MAREKISGIYCITNTTDGKRYVGQSVDMHKRFVQHKASLRRGDHPNIALQRVANKHGIDALSFELVEQCEQSQLNEREKWWIAHYESFGANGYNFTAGGDGTLGTPRPMGEDHPKSRRVLHLNTNKWYASLTEASNAVGTSGTNISLCCRHKAPYAGVFDGVAQVWVFEEEGLLLSDDDRQKLVQHGQCMYASRYKMPYNSRQVVCLNSGDRYESIAAAARTVGLSDSTLNTALNKRGTAAGRDQQTQLPLVWMYADEYENLTQAEIEQRLQDGQQKYGTQNFDSVYRSVVCLNTGEHFRSQAEAAAKYNISSATICSVCSHRRNSYTVGVEPNTGVRLAWMYEDEYESKTPEEIQAYLDDHLGAKKREYPARRKPVVCLTTGVVYDSVAMASADTALSATTIVRCCKGQQKHAIDKATGAKIQWEYASQTA